jgi:hypothetical protein
MCHAPFGTGMERLVTMKKLRDEAVLPAGFGVDYSTEALGSIVRWLVQQQPSQRPSAAMLLESPLLPARVDTDSKVGPGGTSMFINRIFSFLIFSHSI